MHSERYLDHPDCYYNRSCRPLNISHSVPIDWAVPMYGYWMPIIVGLTVATNSFIVIVLSHKYLRTPTNYVLLAMAVSEMFTGMSCLPWFLYYFTFGGYRSESIHGLPPIWCTVSPYVAALLPSIFHTTAIYLTVYLAIQRYIYICHPKLVRRFCTISRSKQVTVIICLFSFLIYCPELFSNYNFSQAVFDSSANRTRRLCYRKQTALLRATGDAYYKVFFSGQTVLVHLVPCIFLVFFTLRLVRAIQLADKRHACLMNKSATRKQTVTNDELDEATRSARLMKPRESVCEPKRVQGLKQNTRMLIVVIILFLITEIPAACIFIIHLLAVTSKIPGMDYRLLNILLIWRNVLIVSSYPFRFAIYCGMSQQFRDVVRQMFTGRFLPNLIRDRDNSTTMALVQGTTDGDEKRSSVLILSSNGKTQSSLAVPFFDKVKMHDKSVQCDPASDSDVIPFDPYLADFSVLVELPAHVTPARDASALRCDVSTQCETKMDVLFVNNNTSTVLMNAISRQTVNTCNVMLSQGP